MYGEASSFSSDPRQRAHVNCRALGVFSQQQIPLFVERSLLLETMRSVLHGVSLGLFAGVLAQDRESTFVELKSFLPYIHGEEDLPLDAKILRLAEEMLQQNQTWRPLGWVCRHDAEYPSLHPTAEEKSAHRAFFPEAWQSLCIVVPTIFRFAFHSLEGNSSQRHGFFLMEPSVALESKGEKRHD